MDALKINLEFYGVHTVAAESSFYILLLSLPTKPSGRLFPYIYRPTIDWQLSTWR